MCCRTATYTVSRRVRASFSPEILQAAAGKGLHKDVRIISDSCTLFWSNQVTESNQRRNLTRLCKGTNLFHKIHPDVDCWSVVSFALSAINSPSPPSPPPAHTNMMCFFLESLLEVLHIDVMLFGKFCDVGKCLYHCRPMLGYLVSQ